MELSGVDRLLSFARELGVQATRNSENSRDVHRPNAEMVVRQAKRDEEGGVRVSLSSTARGFSQESATTGAIPVTAAKAPEPAELPALKGSRRGNAAINAYQRNAASVPGERFQIRA